MPFPSHTQAHTQAGSSENTHELESLPFQAHSGKQYSIVIDDLDALDMLAPNARTARAFMSKLIQSLTQSFCPSGPGSSAASVSVSVPGIVERSLNSMEGVKPDIQTVAVYGRQMSSHIDERGAHNRFFPSSLRVNSVSCGEEPFEPSLSEYCRYRCDLTVALSDGRLVA
jgi:hypothetical protein